MEVSPVKFKWEEYHPIFLSEKYLRSIDDHYGWLGGFSAGDLTFVLPYSWHRKYVFTIGQIHYPTVSVENTIIPDSDFFTWSTSMAWLSILMFRWMKPIPPSRAMVMAVCASVTVSIGALTMGMFKVNFGVSRVRASTSFGKISE